MWAAPVGDGLYRLLHIPLAYAGISMGDVFKPVKRNGAYVGGRTVREGGHSTYRVHFRDEQARRAFDLEWPSVESQGCTYCEAERLFLAIDVPPEVDRKAFFDWLKKGCHHHPWAVNVGHEAGCSLSCWDYLLAA